MQKETPEQLLEWTGNLMDTFSENNSFGVAIFSESGQVLYVNAAMNKLCNNFDSSSILHPSFEKLISVKSDDSLIFSGYLTIGKMNEVNTSIDAKVFRHNDKVLLTGGFDVSSLIEQNRTMHFLNQKVTNLQRQLSLEKAELESTMKKLKETQQMLIHSEKMNALGQMVAGVAHEINNPIAFVNNNLYALENYATDFVGAYNDLEEGIEQKGSEDLKKLIKSIRENAELDYLSEDMVEVIKESKLGVERVKKIVEDLRNFSRLDESEIKRIDLTENIRSTLTLVKSEIAKKNIKFDFEAPPKLMLDCYPGQLNQAILNVLVNAIQAVSADGEVNLKIKEKGDDIHIIFEDNGIGMNENDMKKMFDPFFTTKPVGTGTGLGLSITYKIINDLHKGKIKVESLLNKGTFIIFIIPKELNI